jgi:transposase
LEKYRARATVEHLIHSLKRITGLKPLRVWNESSIRGSMMLALLSETVVAMDRYEIKPRKEPKSKDGKVTMKDVRPSTESMVWSLGHLTLTRIVSKGKRKEAYFSNWDSISREVFANIRAEIGCGAPVFG